MTTTALVIEHLIIGLQAAIWLSLIVLTGFGWNWINLSVLKDFTTILTFVALATVYPIGIFVDELADYIFKPWMKRIRERRFRSEGFEPDDLDLTAMYVLQRTDDQFLKAYFSYIRMRIRVSRFTAFNVALSTITAVIFTSVRFYNSKVFMLILFTEILFGMLITVIAIWVWCGVSDTFAKQTARAFKANPSLNSTK